MMKIDQIILEEEQLVKRRIFVNDRVQAQTKKEKTDKKIIEKDKEREIYE